MAPDFSQCLEIENYLCKYNGVLLEYVNVTDSIHICACPIGSIWNKDSETNEFTCMKDQREWTN